MKIIGHRGAAGLALENSQESIAQALKLNVDAVEFDVHLTKDGHVVVLHDKHTKRVSDEKAKVKNKTLEEIKQITLKNSQKIPTLDEYLDYLENGNAIVEIKSHGVAEKLPEIVKRHPKVKISYASFLHSELRDLRKVIPDAYIYALEHFRPLDLINEARQLHANGIGLNVWLMNPLTYYLAKRYKLVIYVYTLNSTWMASFYKKFYPEVAICTNHPERFKNFNKN